MNNIGDARRSYESTLESGKFTQQDAADFFDVKVGTYSHWEQGKGKLNGEILCRIADKYGCSVDYLLCRTDDPTPYPKGSAELSDDEQSLISDYRDLTPREKASVRNIASTMADSGLAKNNPVRAGEVSA